MQTITLNNTLTLEYPDSFETMTTQELEEAFLDKYADRIGVWDRENHTMFVFVWKKVNPVLCMVVEPDIVRNNSMKAMGRRAAAFESIARFRRKVCGKDSYGFLYKFESKDVKHFGEALYLKYKNCIYSFYSYNRDNGEIKPDPVFEAVLDSVKPINTK